MKTRLLWAGAILVMFVALFVGVRPQSARGQGTSFRILSPAYVLVGEEVYHNELVNPPIGWRLMPYLSFTLPPVPASSLVSLSSEVAITETGEGWQFRAGGWISVGQIPGVVGVERATWGQVKARYR